MWRTCGEAERAQFPLTAANEVQERTGPDRDVLFTKCSQTTAGGPRYERQRMRRPHSSVLAEPVPDSSPPGPRSGVALSPRARRHLGPVRSFGSVVARSTAVHGVFDDLERLARTDVTVTFIEIG